MMLRLVPWSSNEEWKFCYRLIMEDKNYQRAIDLLSLWKQRCSHLPVAVESTLLFLQAFMSDQETVANGKESGRSLYSMFIIRFINGFADQQQNQQFAQSVTMICERLGIPRWLVDLRHECTHERIPSYEVVFNASMIAFDWLKENYWRNHYEFLSRLKLKLHDSLRNYKLITKKELLKTKSTKQSTTMSRAKSILDEFPLLVGEREVRKEFFKILFSPSFLTSKKYPSKVLIKNMENIKRTFYWIDLLQCLREQCNLTSTAFCCELLDCVFEVQIDLPLSQEFVIGFAELLNDIPAICGSINDSIFKIIKDPSKFSNIRFVQFLISLVKRLNCEIDQNLLLLLTSTNSQTLLAINSKVQTLEERHLKLQALKAQLKSPIPKETLENPPDIWTVADTFDLNLPLGHQLPNGSGKNLFEYLIDSNKK